jgi:phosphoglycerate dehydrogenase-like enzyme
MKVVLMMSVRFSGAPSLVKDFPDVTFEQVSTPEEMAAALPGAEILMITNRLYSAGIAEVIADKGKDLRWIQFATSGIDKAIKNGLPGGIPVSNVGGIHGPVISEHVMHFLLGLFRRTREVEQARAHGKWIRDEVSPKIRVLDGATLVVVGQGSIGREVAKKAAVFGSHVIAVTREGKPGNGVAETMGRERFADALGRADAVVMCLPLTTETHHMLGAQEIGHMKPTAFVVNVCRGGVIDQDALIAALNEGRIAGAGLDVVEEEPLAPDHVLWRMDNVLISPHISGAGGDRSNAVAEIFAANLRRYLAGEAPDRVVYLDGPIGAAGA